MTTKPSPPKNAAKPRGARAQTAKPSATTASPPDKPADRPDGANAVRGRPAPIFVHSSFRTASTWLWTRFRASAGTVAYCEIFHEVLATLMVEEIPRIAPNTWRSRHPESSPYFVEFFDLLAEEGGARGFSAAMAFETFVPRAGARGDLTIPELDYVATLINNPVDRARVTVLTDNRTLGRCVGLKRHFGGLHILVYRNLFQQWNSYSNQHRDNNRYFIDTLKNTIEHAEHMEFFRKLKDFLHLRLAEDGRDWIDHCTYDDIFAAFMAIHLYFYMAMFDAVDVFIDVNQLATDPRYMRDIEQAIQQASGVNVDLSSAISTIEAPLKPLADVPGTRFKIDRLFLYAIDEVQPTPEAEAFARKRLDEAWTEHQHFTFYTRSLFAAQAGQSSGPVPEPQIIESRVAELNAESQRLSTLRAEVETMRDAAERMMAEAAQRHQTAMAAQRQEVGALQSQLATQRTAAGSMAARVAALETELRHEATFNEKLTASVDVLQRAFGAVQREMELRGRATDSAVFQRIASLANDADAKVQAMVDGIDELATVLGQERESLASLKERKARDGARIAKLLSRRQAILEQRDAILDLLRATRNRHSLAISMAAETRADGPSG
jgi:hypothetical protein